MDPALAKMMRNIKTEEIKAKRIEITTKDGKVLEASNPQIMKMNAMGQEVYQVVAKFKDKTPSVSKEDIDLVMEKTGKGQEEVEKALQEEGDIAGAIMALSP
jgi:NACalpha-BTF3-like transcription factor